jgi:hypothetical protein
VGRDGQAYDVEILAPPGFSPYRLDATTVLDKFTAITADHLAPAAQRLVVDTVMALEAAPSCDGLMQAVAPNPRSGRNGREPGPAVC